MDSTSNTGLGQNISAGFNWLIERGDTIAIAITLLILGWFVSKWIAKLAARLMPHNERQILREVGLQRDHRVCMTHVS